MSKRSRLGKGAAGGLLAAAMLAGFATPAFAWQDGWSYRTGITLTPSQAGASGTLGSAPVLIRLHSGNFNFADAKPDGSDLRFFAGDDKTPLKFHIEKWSPKDEVALVWVQVPNLSASGATPIFAYYGNPKATPAGDAKGVFGDRAVVWHFAEDGAPQDASGNNVTGSAGAARAVNGLIGQAAQFDGQAGIGLPANFALAAPATVSMWVKPAAAGNAVLFTAPGSLTIGLGNGVPYLDVAGQRATAAAPLAAGSYAHVAAVAESGRTVLYVNGQASGEVAGALPAATGQASIGQGFTGEIDEFQVARAALPAGLLALAANSQGSGAKLASFNKAEQAESGGHGYFGILLNALTPDAWAVIILLAFMSLISWFVMIGKGLTLGRIASANDDFLEAYEKASATQSEHDGLANFDPGAKGASSSLGHLYRVGQRELAKRLAEGRRTGSRFAIRAQSIAAIRSALDAAQAREGQRLNKWMVLLTIAISGGPFLGLLGTVVGVMITFAAVAAAGDVNINAIAPGIAAALLATVAGLAVAIPALFGYNYLLSRVEEIDTDNRIFVDELEKRIAETWQDNDAATSVVAAE
jgi:biopolymer transport protein ExbB